MSTVLIYVLIAGLLPVLCVGLAKGSLKSYDNHQPRDWLAKLHGWRARANAAQANSFEAFPLFASAIGFAYLTAVPADWLSQVALAYVLARLVYIGLYLANLATLRSVVWAVALGLNIWIFVKAIQLAA